MSAIALAITTVFISLVLGISASTPSAKNDRFDDLGGGKQARGASSFVSPESNLTRNARATAKGNSEAVIEGHSR